MRSTWQLDTLFTVGALPDDRDGDGLPDALHVRVVIGSSAQPPEYLAAVDLAARLGFASLALELPLVCSDPDPLPAGIIPLFVGSRPARLPLRRQCAVHGPARKAAPAGWRYPAARRATAPGPRRPHPLPRSPGCADTVTCGNCGLRILPPACLQGCDGEP